MAAQTRSCPRRLIPGAGNGTLLTQRNWIKSLRIEDNTICSAKVLVMVRTPVSSPEREFLPLGTLSQILTVLLACDVALTAARLAAQLLSSGETPARADLAIKPVVIVARVAVAATEILFLVWFRRRCPRPGKGGTAD
jgi:hypothetical protein